MIETEHRPICEEEDHGWFRKFIGKFLTRSSMKHNFSVIANNAFADASQRLCIIQIFDSITTKSFPIIHPEFAVVSSYSCEDPDDKPLIFRVELLSPQKKILANVEISSRKTNHNKFFIGYFRNVAFSEAGAFKLHFYLNNKKYEELRLDLVQDN